MRNMNILEINTAVFFQQQNLRTFAEISDAQIEAWKNAGFDAIWFMGIWQRSDSSKKIALEHPGLLQDFHSTLEDFTDDDVIGSPFAIKKYVPDSRLGTLEDLLILKNKLNTNNLKLILDFVPNHFAIDADLVLEHPEYFMQKQNSSSVQDVSYFKIMRDETEYLIAHGKDPYSPIWTDTAQLNYAKPETKRAMRNILCEIAMFADGIRCDMSMLVLNEVFQKTWGIEITDDEFWLRAIAEVKALKPDFIFIAEAYWDTEYNLQQLGFDFTYDKILYDRLCARNVESVSAHLRADEDYQAHSLRFIENHDEMSASARFSDFIKPAVLISFLATGANLVYQGQLEGFQKKIPVQLCRVPEEQENSELKMFYEKMLEIRCDLKEFHREIISFSSGWFGNESHKNLFAMILFKGNQKYLAVVNFNQGNSQGYLYFPGQFLEDANSIFDVETLIFDDLFSDEIYFRSIYELQEKGMFFDLKPFQAQLFKIDPESKNISPQRN